MISARDGKKLFHNRENDKFMMQFDSNISNSRAMIWIKFLLHFGNKSLQDVRMIYEKESVGVLWQFYSRFIRDDNFLKNCWKLWAFECCLSVCSSFFSKCCHFTSSRWQLCCQFALLQCNSTQFSWNFRYFFSSSRENSIKHPHHATKYPIYSSAA